jgi:hypothetical protein
MKHEAEQLLAECFRRQLAAGANPAGVRYAAGDWFGQIAEHQRMRYRRAIDDLAAEGLLTVTRQFGRRLSHIKLTGAGEDAAAEIVVSQQLTKTDEAALATSNT